MQLSKKELKRLYDIEYRKKNLERLKVQKHLYYQTPAGKATMLRNRKKMGTKYHTEYCRKPEQKLKTKLRDQKYNHGEFFECYRLMDAIFRIVKKHYDSPYERRKARGYYENKLRLKDIFN